MGFDKGYKQLTVATLLFIALVFSFATGLNEHLFPELLSEHVEREKRSKSHSMTKTPASDTSSLHQALIDDAHIFGNRSALISALSAETETPDIEEPFNPSRATRFLQLLLYLAAYSFVLFNASHLLSEGAELLLLIPSVSGLVGSVVLPVLGAVPDGAIVLFSMLGSRASAAANINVGVGALAGSTIMLLTVPWGLSIIKGRVSINADGSANYGAKPSARLRPEDASLTSLTSLMETGVQPSRALRGQAAIMLLTSISYVVLVIPMAVHGYVHKSDANSATPSHADEAQRLFAIIALFTTSVGLVAYIVYCVRQASSEAVDERVKSATLKAMKGAFVSLSSLFDADGHGRDPHFDRKFDEIVRSEFRRYDADASGTIDTYELGLVMRDLGEDLSPKELRALAAAMDTDKDGAISFDEFMAHVRSYALQSAARAGAKRAPRSSSVGGEEDADPETLPFVASAHVQAAGAAGRGGLDGVGGGGRVGGDDDADADAGDDEHAAPDDMTHLPLSHQRFYICIRAAWMMGLGLALILFFSDPIVEVFGALGDEIGVPSFYVSFILAPLASNASELIASVSYASKKTQRSVTIAMQALLGAGSMNNTFCLLVFTAILWVRGFAWEFTAETIAIITIEFMVGALAFVGVQRTAVGYAVLALFPLTIALVAFLEGVVGLN